MNSKMELILSNDDEIRNIIKEKLNIDILNIKLIGEGYDSKAYLINDEYIFKIKFSANKKKSYEKEKAIYDFLNENLQTNIKIPKIEYSYLSEDLSILGYKEIKGTFLTPELYYSLSENEKNLLKQDIATFLKQMHYLDYREISSYSIDNKQNVLEEYQLLKDTIYEDLDMNEKQYVENFMKRLYTTDIFDGKKCLCHNDFSCNHILLDNDNRLAGVIDFGDSGIIDEYCDFIYLLENSEEEIGQDFGIEILKLYGNIDIEKAKEYQDIVEQYYPIETIVYGIKNNRQDFIEKGRQEIYVRAHKENVDVQSIQNMEKCLLTERLKIYPISIDKMKEVVENEKNEILKIAYNEMLNGCLKYPENYIWYTLWFMELKDVANEIVGSLSFKGISENGIVEIGYGINDGYENKGYTTEAVQAVVKWASMQEDVKQIEAEAEETNIASIRVLQKCNFVPNGDIGEEGIRFVWKS